MAGRSLISLILHGAEERNLEYKASMNWGENATRSKVVRAAMSMANIRDGGAIVFGVEETAPGEFQAVGMPDRDADSFNLDDVMDAVNKYADPFVEMEVDRVIWQGRQFVVIQVKEFEEIPVVCRKSGVNLKRGAVYTRSRRKNESVPISSQTEMREVLEMSFDKRMRRYRNRFYKWGLVQKVSEKELVEERFNTEFPGSWDAVPEGVAAVAKPCWKLYVRPGTFSADRVSNPADLQRLLSECAVGLRGEPFPGGMQGGIRTTGSWLEASGSAGGRRWWWRFYRSGQFIAYREFPPEDCEPAALDVLDALAVLTEFYEFAVRLGQKELFGERVHFQVALSGVEGARLYYLRKDVDQFEGFTAEAASFGYESGLLFEELVARADEEALSQSGVSFPPIPLGASADESPCRGAAEAAGETAGVVSPFFLTISFLLYYSLPEYRVVHPSYPIPRSQ